MLSVDMRDMSKSITNQGELSAVMLYLVRCVTPNGEILY